MIERTCMYITLLVLLTANTAYGTSVTVYGPTSPAVDDSESVATCATGYFLHDCDCEPKSDCDGYYMTDLQTCTAYNNKAGSGVKAKATCVLGVEGNQKYIDKISGATSANFTLNPTATCPAGTTLVGCSVHTSWIQDVTPGTKAISGNTCSIIQDKTRVKVRCQASYCGDPGAINFATMNVTDFYSGGTVTYICDSGFETHTGFEGTITCQTNAQWTEKPRCQQCNPIDLGILLDESGSVGISNWPYVVNFAANLVKGFDVGLSRTRVGLAKFGQGAKLEFKLNTYNTKADVLNHIYNLPYGYQPYTDTQAGLKMLRTQVFDRANGDRDGMYGTEDYPSIAVVFTDGYSNYKQWRTVPEAINLQRSGVRIVTVAVAPYAYYLNFTELQAISTDPDSTNLIWKKSFKDLDVVLKVIKEKVCDLGNKCPDPGPVNHAFKTSGTLSWIGSEWSYQCYGGYLVDLGVNNGSITCLENMTWTEKPVCKGYCDDPSEIGHASRNGSLWWVDDTVTYTCDVGYEISPGVNSATIKCGGDLEWTARPTCSLIGCGLPDSGVIPADANRYISHTLLGGHAVYFCNDGYKMTSGDSIRECQLDKTWNGAPPVCTVIDCGDPDTLPLQDMTRTISGTSLGSVISYTCDEGFDAVCGAASMTRTCMSSGTWSGDEPSCKQNFCPDPDSGMTPEGADRSFSNPAFTAGVTVSYIMKTGYIHDSGSLTRTCLSDKTWSGTPPRFSKVGCSKPTQKDSMPILVLLENKIPYEFGSLVSYVCPSNYKLEQKTLYRKCLSDGTWSGVEPTCQDHLKCRAPDETLKYVLAALVAAMGLAAIGTWIYWIKTLLKPPKLVPHPPNKVPKPKLNSWIGMSYE